MGHAGLVGWRAKVGDKAAKAVSKRSRFDTDTVRAVLGAVFLALSLKTTAEMITRLNRAVRGQRVG